MLALVAVAGCAATESRVNPHPSIGPVIAPAWKDTGTPPASIVTLEREVRYYKDETGAIWDDRGRKLGTAP